MFQHYKSVFQLSPPRAPSISLSHTRDNVLLSVSTSLGRALRSLAVNLNGLAVCVCTGRACIVIHPFSALVWVQPDVSSINKTFFFSKASWTLFFGDLERSFFSGTYFACEDGFSKRLVLIFKCLLPFFRRLQQISQRWLRLVFWMYINSVTLTHTFRIARITIRKILFSGL